MAGGRGAVLQHRGEQVFRVGSHALALVLHPRLTQGIHLVETLTYAHMIIMTHASILRSDWCSTGPTHQHDLHLSGIIGHPVPCQLPAAPCLRIHPDLSPDCGLSLGADCAGHAVCNERSAGLEGHLLYVPQHRVR